MTGTGAQIEPGVIGAAISSGGVGTLPIDVAAEAVPDPSRADAPPLALDHRGGDVWAWEKLISGTCRGLDDETGIAILVNDARWLARRDGDRFEVSAPPKPGANTVQAIATLEEALLESDRVIHTVRLSPRPTARIAATASAAGLALDGSVSVPSDYDAAPIVAWSWSWSLADADRSNSVALAIAADGAGVVTLPVPEMDCEYAVTLTATDERGRSDAATVLFVVEGGQVRIVDIGVEQAAWTRGATVYGVVVRNVGAAGYQSVIDRLDDLADLGVAALWLAPINVTTPSDFGYGVVDYFGLRPEYGTRDDFKRLVEEAHARNIRVLMDVVPNHTSSEHPYYRDAQRHGGASPYHGFYDRDAEGEATHYFSWTHLPNLDCDHAEVRRFMTEALMYWVREFDVDGFRVDVAWGIRQRRPDFWPEFSAEFHRVKPDGLLIAEASARDPYYVNHGFDAAYDWTDDLGVWAWTDAFASETPIAAGIERALANREGGGYDPKSFIFRFLNNNDTGPRFVTTHGVDLYRLATAMLLTLPGLPCVYTGDEVGAEFEPYADPGPIDWTDRHGLRADVRKLIRLRRELPALGGQGCTMLAVEPAGDLLVYVRFGSDGETPVLVLLNFSADDADAAIDSQVFDRFFNGVHQPTHFHDLYNNDGEIVLATDPCRRIPVPAWGIRILATTDRAAQ